MQTGKNYSENSMPPTDFQSSAEGMIYAINMIETKIKYESIHQKPLDVFHQSVDQCANVRKTIAYILFRT